MEATKIDLPAALQAIAARWSSVAVMDQLAPLVTVGGGEDWSLDELQALLEQGEAEPLLDWLRQRAAQARRAGLSIEAVSALIGSLAATIGQLAGEALTASGAGPIALAEINASLIAAGLAGSIGAGETPGGDLAGRLARLEALQRINRAANTSLHLTAMLDQVVEAVADVIKSDTCSIWTYQETSDELVLRAARGLNLAAIGRVRLRLGQAITGEAARIRQPIKATDARAHPAYLYIPALGEEKYRSQVSVPIIRISVDRLVGVLTLKTIEPREFEPDEISFLRTVAGELAIAVENAQLYQQTDVRLRDTVKELRSLQRVSARMAETLDLAEVLNIIAYSAADLGHAQRVEIIRVDRETGQSEVMAHHGAEEPLPETWSRIQRELIQEVVSIAAPLQKMPAGSMVGLTSAQRPAGEVEGVSIYGMPLRTLHGVLGVICLHYTTGDEPSDSEQHGVLVSFANAAAIALENAQLYAEAQRNLAVTSALLQEMHHRVGNNLEAVAGLLKMQMRRSKEVNWALQDSYSRIQSMAAVHELLSKDDVGIATVDEIAKLVAKEADASLTPPGYRYTFHVGGQPVEVTSRQATLLAMVINEVVVNALRHGLRERTIGDVWLAGRVEGGQVVVTIEDNGSGLPANFDLERETGLGLSIIRTLVGVDLGGRLAMATRPEGGTRVTITFPFRPRLGSSARPDTMTMIKP